MFFRVIGVRPEVRRVRSRSMDSLWCALADIRIGCALGVVGFVQVRWVHLGVPWGKSGSFGVAGFIGVCPGGHHVYSKYALGFVTFVRGL